MRPARRGLAHFPSRLPFLSGTFRRTERRARPPLPVASVSRKGRRLPVEKGGRAQPSSGRRTFPAPCDREARGYTRPAATPGRLGERVRRLITAVQREQSIAEGCLRKREIPALGQSDGPEFRRLFMAVAKPRRSREMPPLMRDAQLERRRATRQVMYAAAPGDGPAGHFGDRPRSVRSQHLRLAARPQRGAESPASGRSRLRSRPHSLRWIRVQPFKRLRTPVPRRLQIRINRQRPLEACQRLPWLMEVVKGSPDIGVRRCVVRIDARDRAKMLQRLVVSSLPEP